MFLVGLTGGIGAGKSTVASGLARLGAGVVDADAISRSLLEPGGEAYQPVIDRFGPDVVRADGTIDRPALAAVVFTDPAALADLNDLTHPRIGRIMGERMDALAADHQIVVLDIPLLEITDPERFPFGAIVVVDIPEDQAVERLVRRGLTVEDARARMAAQLSRQERRQLADFVVDNRGGRRELQQQIDRLWGWLQERAGGGDPPT